jgi:hypothetical protein
MSARLLLALTNAIGSLIIAIGASGAPPKPDLQFQLDTDESKALDIEKFFEKREGISALPVRALWTQKSKDFWIEQDGRMRQRGHEVAETGAMVDGHPGVILRLREYREDGEAAEETFIPIPDTPTDDSTAEVQRRMQVPGAAPAAWKPVGRPAWCGGWAPSRHPALPEPPDPTLSRTWKSRDGAREFKGRLVSGNPGELKFQLETGKSITARFDHFSEDDQILLLRWLEANPWPVRYPTTVSVPMSEGKGLSRVARASEPGKQGDIDQPYTYETKHFDFGSSVPLGENHLHAVGVSFEATRRLVGALPWFIQLPEGAEERSRVKLFETRGEYRAAGGSDFSAGFYQPKSRIFFVPFESVGLIPDEGKEHKLDRRKIVYGTLHHELTHQQMHESLGFLPMWLVEGAAEFVGNLAYSEGAFRLEAGPEHLRRFFAPSPLLKKLAERARPADEPKEPPVEYAAFDEVLKEAYWPRPAETRASGVGIRVIMIGEGEEDPRKTRLRYNSAFLLVYYFVYLDPDRSRLPRFLLSARRLALEIKAVERAASSYDRQWIDPYNRKVLENYARIDAYNRLVASYNHSMRSGGSEPRPGPPIWATLEQPPPRFSITGDAAAFFEAGVQIGRRALTWTPPNARGQIAASPKPREGKDDVPSEVPPRQPPPPVAPSIGVGVASSADPRNSLPFAAVILKNQEAAFGTPAEVAERVRAAYAKHGFPLP